MMKLITKDTGISIALVLTLVGGAVGAAMAYASVNARVATLEEEKARTDETIKAHQVEDKQVVEKIEQTHVTKTEIDLGNKIITTKLDALTEKVNRIDSKLDIIIKK